MFTKAASMLTLFLLAGVSAAEAQEFKLESAGTTGVLIQSTNTATATQDRVAVRGVSTPQPFWGIGGEFIGGYKGVVGSATMASTGSNYAVSGYAAGATTNYGVYASAWGGTYNYAGYFSGNVYVTGTLSQASDKNLKSDIQDLGEVLPSLMKLKPKTYRYKTKDFPKMNLPEGQQVGLVAQEVADVFPAMVHEAVVPAEGDQKGQGAGKFLAVDYSKLGPLLVQSVQDLQRQIDVLKKEIDVLKKK
jgi:hypothetical protein